MVSGFMKDTVDILDVAHVRARQDRLRQIGTFHVLFALLNSNNKAVAEGLVRLGLDAKSTTSRIEGIYSNLEPSQPFGIEFCSRMEDVLESAAQKASLQARHVEPLDLLYAILVAANPSGVLFEWLQIPADTDPEVIYKPKSN